MREGFTLIELLIAVAVFVLVVAAATGIFVSSIKAQRQALASRVVLDESSYLIEYISRALRMAKKDISGLCLTTAGPKTNYETNVARNRIRFLNYLDKCQEFFLEGGALKEQKSIDSTANNFQSSQNLTSAQLQVITFKVDLAGHFQDDNLQPKATLFFNIKKKGLGAEPQPEIKIQTAVSQRSLDIER